MAGMTRRGAWGARRVARCVFCDGENELAEATTIASMVVAVVSWTSCLPPRCPGDKSFRRAHLLLHRLMEAWEPAEWVAARGPSQLLESEHFCVRWGDEPCSGVDPAQIARDMLPWLESFWQQLCDPASEQFFVTPYTTPGWSDDGRRRKMNVYLGDTGLHPHPHSAGWAHQGTHVELTPAVCHAVANPEGKLHHSFLALKPAAARSARTVCHELTHCLQMHTGGHINSEYVGYQWEAHAEYCVHLSRPIDVEWVPHLKAFLDTAHLPPDCTNAHDGEGAGRQYIVWPFYCFLDAHVRRGLVHGLWHADFAQRRSSGAARDMISNLLASGELAPASSTPPRHSLGQLFGEFAEAALAFLTHSVAASRTCGCSF